MISNKLKIIIVAVIILIVIIFIVVFNKNDKSNILSNNIENIKSQTVQEDEGNFILYDEYGNQKASGNIKESFEIYEQDNDYEEKLPLEESGIIPSEYDEIIDN